MIHDVDKSLRDMLLTTVVRGGNVEVSFDMPDKDWAAKRQGPALNVYLFEIAEDLERRQVQYEPEYDGEGIVIGRRTPKRRFKLEYLVSAWADRAEDEHRLLSAVLEAFVIADEVPRGFLTPPLAELAPIGVTIALPVKGRSIADVWRPMGTAVRPALHVVVTLPVGGRIDPHVGPPVLEGPTVALRGPDGQLIPPMGRFSQGAAEEGSPADEKTAAGVAPTREVIDAGRFRAGSRVRELTEEDVRPGRRIGVQTVDPRTPPRP